jgi:hypothetical protein
MDPATLAAMAAKARKALAAIKAARQVIQEGGIPWWLYAVIAVILMLPIIMLTMILIIPMAALAIIVNEVTEIPGFKLVGGALTGIGCALGSDQACAIKELIDAAKEAGIDDAIKSQVDCQNVDPDFPEEWCDPGALDAAEDQALPIPPDKAWLIPLYVKAGVDEGVPWELLAAIHATRTNFGDDNCRRVERRGVLGGERVIGGGFYNFTKREWVDFGYDAGTVSEYVHPVDKPGENRVPVRDSWGSIDEDRKCVSYTPELRTKIYNAEERDERKQESINEDGSAPGDDANIHDPVDAIYTQARILKHYGIENNFYWSEYTGGPALSCAGTGSDMPFQTIYPYTAGGNARVPIPQDIIALAERYTFATWTQPTFPAEFGQVPGEKRGFQSSRVVPKEARIKFYYAAGRGLGMPDNIIRKVIPNLERLSKGESGWDSSRLQGEIGDVNDSYPLKARGMFQITPGTFKGGKVPGYDNIYNPLHNILAAMNMMRNATSMDAGKGPPTDGWDQYDNLGEYGLWPWTSGWSPGYRNPYAGDQASTGPEGPYRGPTINYENDPVAKAVASRPGEGVYYDPCYVAHVHDWYQAFVDVSLGVSFGSVEAGLWNGKPIPGRAENEPGWKYLERLGKNLFGLRNDCAGASCYQMTGGNHSSGSDHYPRNCPQGCAIDHGDAKNSKQQLDAWATFLQANSSGLCVKQVIWQGAGHYDHTHASVHPQPCPQPYPPATLTGSFFR